MTTTLAEHLDSALKVHIYAVLNAHKEGQPLPEPVDFIPDSFGALIERLAIEHVRAWILGDEIGMAIIRDNKDAVVALNKKLDACFKVMRPRLIAAINRKSDDAILHGRSLVEESVKLYKGYADIDAPAPPVEPKEINFLALIEEIAKAIHDGWMEEKRQLGFTRGPERDAVKKTHPHFCSWEELETKSQDRFWAAMLFHDWLLFGKQPIRPKEMHEAWRFWPRLHGMTHPHDKPFDEVHGDGSVEHEEQARFVNAILSKL